MIKRLLFPLLVFLALLSSAIARPKSGVLPQAPKKDCVSPADAKKVAPKTVKFDKTFTDDELARFKAGSKAIPDEVNGADLYTRDDGVKVAMLFKDGCILGVALFPAARLDEMLSPKDDGSI